MSALGRASRALFAALAFGAPMFVAAQGCSTIIGAGDYKVSSCESLSIGLPIGVAFVGSSSGSIVSVGLIAGGKPDSLRELRAYVGTDASSYALASSDSFDLNACVNCVWIYEWDASDLTKPTRAFVGTSGTLSVTSPSTAAGERVGFELSGVKFVEATYDAASGIASPVAGGACIGIASASVSTKTCAAAGGCEANEVCSPVAYATAGICQPGGDGAPGAPCDPAQSSTGCNNGYCDGTTRTCNQVCDYWGGVPVCPAGTVCTVFGACYAPTVDPAAVGIDCTSASGTFCGQRGALISGACADKGAGKITCEKICRLNGTDCPTGKTCKSAGLDPAGYCE